MATRLAESVGIDPGTFRREMGLPEVSAELAKNMRDADELGIQATPGLVTARAVVQGALGLEQLQALVDTA